MGASTDPNVVAWPLACFATRTFQTGSKWSETHGSVFYAPTLTYSFSGARAALSVANQGSGTSGRAQVEWNREGGPSASTYQYRFESKNVLVIAHFLGGVLSDAVKLAFVSANDLDECLAVLPGGQNLFGAVQPQGARRSPQADWWA